MLYVKCLNTKKYKIKTYNLRINLDYIIIWAQIVCEDITSTRICCKDTLSI